MLKYRLISGATMVGIMIAAVFWEAREAGLIFLLIAGLAVTYGLREFFGMTEKMGAAGFYGLTAATGVGYLAFAALAGATSQPIGRCPGRELCLALLVIAGVLRVFRSDDFKVGIRSLGASIGGFIYLPWMLSFLVSVYFMDFTTRNGPYLVFFLVMCTKMGDIGGYTAGRITGEAMGGNHKMVPRLSPKKSWEGFVGSLVFSGALGAGLFKLMESRLVIADVPVMTMTSAIILGVVLAAVGLAGDLAVSAMKRASEVKDSGDTIPGMGGVLDVLDSLVLVSPLFYCYLKFVTM
jgi:phosphatidate cytidylyltransferase